MKISNWQENENFKHKSSRINKNKFCKKNKKSGNNFGPHTYGPNSIYCTLCGHIDKSKLKNNFTEN